jgi:hypothetical protein
MFAWRDIGAPSILEALFAIARGVTNPSLRETSLEYLSGGASIRLVGG